MKMSAEQLQSKWDEVIELITNTFEGKRKDNILKMYDYFKDRMMFAPASGVIYYHNAFPGGYVCHILNVTRFALELYETYDKLGLHTSEYNKEAIIFCALHHDLGKVGNLEYDYYTPNKSEWHRVNQGKMYNYDDRLHYMTVTDRAVWLLSHFDIKMSEVEYLALRLTDGMYEEANKAYYIAYQPERQLRSNIAYILHQADMMATHIEYDEWKRSEEQEDVKVQGRVDNIKKAVTMKETSEQLNKKSKDLFDELFGDK